MSQAIIEHSNSLDSSLEAVVNLPPNLAVMKLENDNIMAMSTARPRDIKAMIVALREQLDAFPIQANRLIFSKPVGKESDVCGDCGKELWPDKRTKKPATFCFSCHSKNVIRGGQKFARGLSIRAAEMLAEVYKYNRVRVWQEPVDKDSIKVCATFTDYQNGRTWSDESIVSRFYTNRDQQLVRIPEDRFYGVVARAVASKVVREVINRCMNPMLKAWLWDEAEKCIDNNLDEGTVTKILGSFASKKVSLEVLERLIGRPRNLGWTKEDRKTLVGIWNAIESGEMTVDELLSQSDADEDKSQPSNSRPEATATATENALKNPQLATTPEKSPDKTNGGTAAVTTGSTEGGFDRPQQSQIEAYGQLSSLIAACKSFESIEDIRKQIAESQMINDEQRKLLNAILARHERGMERE